MTLKAFVSDSTLSQEDKDLWFSILEKLDSNQTKIYEDFIDGQEGELKALTDNLRAKINAIKKLDESALEEIVSREALSSKQNV